MLAIADAERPAVIAGIFGAEFAEVHDGTTRVLLEAASFDGPTILDTSLRLGLRSESSGRFEKGLPRELPARGMSVASRLLVELVGATHGAGHDRRRRARAPRGRRCACATRACRGSWASRSAAEESEAILGRLGLGRRPGTRPSWPGSPTSARPTSPARST